MTTKLRKIPAWGWLAGFALLGLNYALYTLAHFLSIRIGTIAYAVSPRTGVDGVVPMAASFVLIYLLSYAFWVVGVAVISLLKKKDAANALIGFALAYFMGFLILTLWPTYMDRAAEGALQAAQNPDIFSRLLGWVYVNDGGQYAYNLFPSFHCLSSVYCFLAVHRRKEVSAEYRVFAFVMAALICISVLATRQHYLLDVLGGTGIAIVCYTAAQILNPGRRISE